MEEHKAEIVAFPIGRATKQLVGTATNLTNKTVLKQLTGRAFFESILNNAKNKKHFHIRHQNMATYFVEMKVDDPEHTPLRKQLDVGIGKIGAFFIFWRIEVLLEALSMLVSVANRETATRINESHTWKTQAEAVAYVALVLNYLKENHFVHFLNQFYCEVLDEETFRNLCQEFLNSTYWGAYSDEELRKLKGTLEWYINQQEE